MKTYYNEFDPKAAAWLRELIRAELISPGEVDERSIAEVKPADLRGFDRVHFFAGIGGWDYALRLAGWPDDRPVWTGSCPCQPFSSAGKQKGVEDERHLWPVFSRLIAECRPPVVFGEQVASAIGHGWLDGVFGDLESENYACGAAVLGAHSVGAPHIRQRLYWVADSNNTGPQGHRGLGEESIPQGRQGAERHSRESVPCGGVGHTIRTGERGRDKRGSGTGREQMAQQEHGARPANQSGNGCEDASGGVAHAESERDERAAGATREAECGQDGAMHREPWRASRAILCRDNKSRRIPVEPAFFPLADGLPARVVRLRGYGNAIVPQVAAAFVEAYLG